MATYNSSIFGSPTPVSPTTVTASNNGNDFLKSILPNYGQNQSQVGGIITNLLNGTPSPSTVRNAAATFGVENGLGTGSGVTNRYGYDLYNQEGQKRQQLGIQDLLSYLSGASQPILESQAQANQIGEFNAGQKNQVGEFNSSQSMQWLNELLSKYGGNSNNPANPSGLSDGTYFTPAGSSSYIRQ